MWGNRKNQEALKCKSRNYQEPSKYKSRKNR
jgi:hypothetical protein